MFDKLETFIHLFEEKNYSKVAEKLYISQPTVTNQIQKIEQEYDITLFNRINNKITPTKTGVIFYKYAKQIQDLNNNMIYELNQGKNNLSGTVCIGSSSIPQLHILPTIIKDFLSIHSNIKFKITTSDSKSVVNQIENGYVDFGIVGAKIKSSTLLYTEVMKDNIILALPSSYKDKYEPYEKIPMNEFLNIPLIVREEGSGTRMVVEKALNKADISINELNIIINVSLNDAVVNLIKQDIGGSIISEIAVKKEIESKEIIPVYINELEINRSFYLAYHKNKSLSPICNEFKKFIQNIKS